MLRRALLAFALMGAVTGAIAADATNLHYRLTDLGDLTTSRKLGATFPTAIDAKGEVVGRTFDNQLRARAFIWQKGRMTDLGDLGNLQGEVPSLEAFAINDHAEVVGTSTASVAGTSSAFDWKGDRISNLGTLGGSGTSTFAWSVNAHGDIVGAAYTPAGELRAVRWVKGAPVEIGMLPDGRVAMQAFSINDKGQIVGYLSPGGSAVFAHAFIWSNGKFTDLGTLPGTTLSLANAVNARGQVVGQSYNAKSAGSARAFLWQDGTLLDLGSALRTDTISAATAINKHGAVVGSSGDAFSSTAWVWRNGVNQNLNNLIAPNDPNGAYVTLTEAVGINDGEQIIAQGIDRRIGPSALRGYVLTPVK